MGNCIVTRRTGLFQKKKGKPTTALTKSCDSITIRKNSDVREKRTSDDDQDVKSGGATRVMRIRVVVTQSQLSQIMKESRNSASLSASSAAVKQMLLTSARKMSDTENSLRSYARCDQRGSMNGKWRPRLKSIVEE